ncbi:MAG TPA: riboflavin synthase [Mycobacteriales bacterium]|nr:riboflavin synthase [Mycobacteriales bacterium]
MFTGIVEDLGVVTDNERMTDSARLTIAGAILDDLQPGDSVAVNGVCLTATDVRTGAFVADVMDETLQRSALGLLDVGATVNLERAVMATSRLGGHLVQGHVDGVGRVSGLRPAQRWTELDVDVPGGLARYVVSKGSITLDGVSLTVARVEDATVTVSLIPETLARTTLGSREVGDSVNVEVDVLAKYVERLLQSAPERGDRR